MDKEKLILICYTPVILCSFFAVPLYYVLSGKVNEHQNIVYTAVVTAIVMWWMYMGTVYFGECVIDIFDLRPGYKYIVAVIMGLIYFAMALSMEESEKNEKNKN